MLRAFAQDHQLTIVDLQRSLIRTPKRREKYFDDPVHPNEAGHALIAKQIVAVVRRPWERLIARKNARKSKADQPGELQGAGERRRGDNRGASSGAAAPAEGG